MNAAVPGTLARVRRVTEQEGAADPLSSTTAAAMDIATRLLDKHDNNYKDVLTSVVEMLIERAQPSAGTSFSLLASAPNMTTISVADPRVSAFEAARQLTAAIGAPVTASASTSTSALLLLDIPDSVVPMLHDFIEANGQAGAATVAGLGEVRILERLPAELFLRRANAGFGGQGGSRGGSGGYRGGNSGGSGGYRGGNQGGYGGNRGGNAGGYGGNRGGNQGGYGGNSGGYGNNSNGGFRGGNDRNGGGSGGYRGGSQGARW